MNLESVAGAVRAHLTSVAPGTDPNLPLDSPLLESNLLDSLGIIQLMTFLADNFGIEVSDEDFVPENFATIRSLVNFVLSKRPAAA